jgi:hypothetical protein
MHNYLDAAVRLCSHPAMLLHGVLALALVSITAAEQTVLGADRWAGLRAQLGARLQPGAPFAAACFASDDMDTAAVWTTGTVPNATGACAHVRAHYLDECMRLSRYLWISLMGVEQLRARAPRAGRSSRSGRAASARVRSACSTGPTARTPPRPRRHTRVRSGASRRTTSVAVCGPSSAGGR